jgi:hypothetical protein
MIDVISREREAAVIHLFDRLSQEREQATVQMFDKLSRERQNAITQIALKERDTIKELLTSKELQEVVEHIGSEGGEIVNITFVRGTLLILLWLIAYVGAKLAYDAFLSTLRLIPHSLVQIDHRLLVYRDQSFPCPIEVKNEQHD